MKTTDEALAELIRKGIETAEKTGKFVIDQAPDLLQQFYRWHIVKDVLGIILCASIFIISFIFTKRNIVKVNKDELDFDEPVTFFSVMFGGLISILSLGFLCSVIYDITFVLVSPKLYLIEYFIK